MTPDQRRTLECLRDLFLCPDKDWHASLAMLLDHLETINDPRIEEVKWMSGQRKPFWRQAQDLILEIFGDQCKDCCCYQLFKPKGECKTCENFGVVLYEPATGKCPSCNGSRHIGPERKFCSHCGGFGRVVPSCMTDQNAIDEVARRWGEFGCTYQKKSYYQPLRREIVIKDIGESPLEFLRVSGFTWEEAFCDADAKMRNL